MWAGIFQSVATRYGLGGPGIESRWVADFPHSSWTVLEPIQSPVQWVSGFFSGDKAARRWCRPHIPISTEVKERVQLYLSCSIWAFTVCYGVNYFLLYFNFTLPHVKSFSQHRQYVLPKRNFPYFPTLLQSIRPQSWVLKCNIMHLIHTMDVSV